MHADNEAANKQRRLHITLELPWAADKIIQQVSVTCRPSVERYELLRFHLFIAYITIIASFCGDMNLMTMCPHKHVPWQVDALYLSEIQVMLAIRIAFLKLAHCHGYQLGRTHRSNEAVGPKYRLLVTNVGGESRFVSAAGLLVPSFSYFVQCRANH